MEKIEEVLKDKMLSLHSTIERLISQSYEETLKNLRGKAPSPLSEKPEDPKAEDYVELFKLKVKGRLEDLLNII